MTRAELATVVSERWEVAVADLEALPGGMNSQTWRVQAGAEYFVAKLVPHAERSSFVAGLAAAQAVARAGLPSGEPVCAVDGSLFADISAGLLALLRWVDGEPLTGADGELALIGETLGTAHSALLSVAGTEAPRFHWIDLDAAHLDTEDWIRPAVRDAVAGWEAVAAAVPTWGLLHGDPNPEAFLRIPRTDACGLIDWSSCFYGPLLYDLASAAMYVGGPEAAQPLVDAYRLSGLLGQRELNVGLVPMIGFRWAVRADYFARRLTRNDLTGIPDERGNLKGLADARRHLERR